MMISKHAAMPIFTCRIAKSHAVLVVYFMTIFIPVIKKKTLK